MRSDNRLPCKYCEYGEYIDIKNDAGRMANLKIDIDSRGMNIFAEIEIEMTVNNHIIGGDTIEIDTNIDFDYCPFCGRKLKFGL